VTINRPDDLRASKLSSEGASCLFEALHVAQAAWTHVPPVRRAVPALGVIHGLQAPVWIHALRALVSIPLVARASLLLLAYSPCAERERREREVERLALIHEWLVFRFLLSAERFRRAAWFLCAERSLCAT
jgi:hypothetical protein